MGYPLSALEVHHYLFHLSHFPVYVLIRNPRRPSVHRRFNNDNDYHDDIRNDYHHHSTHRDHPESSARTFLRTPDRSRAQQPAPDPAVPRCPAAAARGSVSFGVSGEERVAEESRFRLFSVLLSGSYLILDLLRVEGPILSSYTYHASTAWCYTTLHHTILTRPPWRRGNRLMVSIALHEKGALLQFR